MPHLVDFVSSFVLLAVSYDFSQQLQYQYKKTSELKQINSEASGLPQDSISPSEHINRREKRKFFQLFEIP